MTGKAPAPRKSTGPVTPAARKSSGGAVVGKTSVQVKGKAAQDPRFQKTVKNLQDRSRQLGKHEPASKKRSDLENAAQDPVNARSAGAAASQVATMDSAPTGTVQPGSFTTLLRQEIDRLMPQTLENADQFMQHGEASQIQQAAGGAVQQQTDDAAGTLQATAAQAPDPAGQPVRTPQPMGTEAPPAPPVIDTSGAVPPPKKNFDAGLKQNLDTSKDEIKKTELPETSFQKANDSRFSKVTEQNQKLQSQAAKSIQGYPKTETQIQSAAKAAVSGDSKKGAASLVKARVQGSAVVRLKQQTAKERNEARRKAVVDNIERIYNKTKTSAQNHIEGLQEKAMQLFEQGLNRASENLKRNAELEKQKFRNERYSGVTGAARWVADLFRECPDGLKEGFRRARAKFTQETDVLVNKVGQFVDSRIKAARAEIQRGQAEIQTYVQSLPADLQSVGQNAQKDMETRFSEMQQNIDSQAQELAQKLAERYQKAQEDADSAIKKLEEENSGMLKGLIDAVGEVIKVLREFKARLQAALRKGEETIKLILNDPILFLSNLLAAIKGGLNAFVGNIWTHLKAGFMQWLFGSLMKAGIQPPSDLSLGSIFKLVLQVLGITYDRMRAKAVKLIGERNVKILEKLYEYIQTLISGGVQALWEKVKEDLANLKQMVIDAIQNWLIETVIKQAIMKVVSMFNPAGAIVQAVITIYNTVMFLWEKANQILSFVEAVINSIHAIATGAIGGAVAWIERSLASMIPLVIGFLARLIGLGNVSSKIREFILKVQGKVDAAIDKLMGKIVATVKKLFGKGKGGKDKGVREVSRGFGMTTEGHHLFAVVKNGKVVIEMASGRREALEVMLSRAQSEANGNQGVLKDLARIPPYLKNAAEIAVPISDRELDARNAEIAERILDNASSELAKIGARHNLKSLSFKLHKSHKYVDSKVEGYSIKKEFDIRKTFYPGKYDPPTRAWKRKRLQELIDKADLLQRARGIAKPNRNLFLDLPSGDLVDRSQATIDHKPWVVKHWNKEGHTQTQAERHTYFNDYTQGFEVIARKSNSSDGAEAKKETGGYNRKVTESFRGPGDPA